jgi:hypothetical protein
MHDSRVIDLRPKQPKPIVPESPQIKEKPDERKSDKRFFVRIKCFFLAHSLAFAVVLAVSGVAWWEWRSFSATSRFESTHRAPAFAYPNGMNLVFVAESYDLKDRDAFESDVTMLMTQIRTTEPWKSYQRFNTYTVFPDGDDLSCVIQTENERKPTLYCDESLNRQLAAFHLDRFKVIVLSRREFQSWANVARLRNSGVFFSIPERLNAGNAPRYGVAILHLLGHAFGLKDEEKFVVAKAGGAPHTPDGPNCAPDRATAESWWGDLAKAHPERVGYFPTCGGSEQFISPTKGSIMNLGDMSAFVADYGPVSEEYLKTMIDLCFSDSRQENAETITEQTQTFLDRYPEFRECRSR